MKKLPLGTQSFEVLRRSGDVYVDKTEDIYNLISSGRIYFLSRPRRFGKSLLISTLKELFKGNKEIFEGLYMCDKWNWSKKYPVIHLDFAEIDYTSVEELKKSLMDFINSTVINYNVSLTNSTLGSKFGQLIEQLHKASDERVVILVDEYDKPLIDSLNKAREVHQEIKETLHNFYQVIKGSDEHIKFMFMTGVSRFAGLSVFSALNNLNDITMNSKYAGICGYTQEELEDGFKEYIGSTAEYMGISKEELLTKIKYWYNGYSWDGEERVYNPFSMLAVVVMSVMPEIGLSQEINIVNHSEFRVAGNGSMGGNLDEVRIMDGDYYVRPSSYGGNDDSSGNVTTVSTGVADRIYGGFNYPVCK
ncbi:MAG: AAA family ATPase [Endomicrobium sp.]|jgi:hypothetical protein|nr:AAA family ATPase [Endomicrobium sp.]